jgi:hypothetical protein
LAGAAALGRFFRMSRLPPPPILPERKLERVLRVSRANSIGVFVCAGLSFAFSLPGGAYVFAAFSALALVAAWMEWQGQQQLRAGFAVGMSWLVGAQACLYTVIAGYALWRLSHFDPAAYWTELPEMGRERVSAQMTEAGLDPESDRDLLLQMMNFVIIVTLVSVSTLYQGGLAFWYQLQRRAVVAALENPSTAELSRN